MCFYYFLLHNLPRTCIILRIGSSKIPENHTSQAKNFIINIVINFIFIAINEATKKKPNKL